MKKVTPLCILLAMSRGEITVTASPDRPHFDRDAFYTITISVTGQELALTFVPPAGASLTTSPARSRVELRPLSHDPAQRWQFHREQITPRHSYTIFSKVSDAGDQLTGILRLSNPDNQFRPHSNRLTIGARTQAITAFWHVASAGDGMFKIRSLLGHPEHLNRRTERSAPDRWDHERALEITVEGGAFTATHGPIANTPAQLWKITRVDS